MTEENSSNSSTLNSVSGKEETRTKTKQEPSYTHFCFRFTHETISSVDSGFPEILSALKILKVRCAIFQLEAGEGGVPHYQGYFEFEKGTKKRRQPLRDFFCSEYFPDLKFPLCDYLEPAKSVPGSVRYCMKEEGRIEGPWSIGAIHLMTGKKKDLYPLQSNWQKELFDYLRDNEPDHRTIIYVNKEYEAGKSLLCRHIYRELGGVLLDGYERHILDVVSNTDKSIYMYNDVADGKRIPWNALEKVKDGFFCGYFGTKGTGMFELSCLHPHLIVFSNREFDDAIAHSKIDPGRFKFF